MKNLVNFQKHFKCLSDIIVFLEFGIWRNKTTIWDILADLWKCLGGIKKIAIDISGLEE